MKHGEVSGPSAATGAQWSVLEHRGGKERRDGAVGPQCASLTALTAALFS